MLKEVSDKQISNETSVFLKKSGNIGQRETMKQRIKRAFYLEKAGIQLDDDSRLFKKQKREEEEEE